MGWRLTEAVLADCPDIPYREFRVFIAFAMDARDTTCEGMPGMELLAARGRCTERQARRLMASLIKRGFIETAKRSAPGRRTVYRMLPLPGSPAERGTQPLSHVGVPVDNSANVGHFDVERGTFPGQRGTQPLAPSLSHPLVTSPLSSTNGSVVGGPVEGNPAAADEASPDLHTRRGTEKARMAAADKLNEWMRTHDPETGAPLAREAAP